MSFINYNDARHVLTTCSERRECKPWCRGCGQLQENSGPCTTDFCKGLKYSFTTNLSKAIGHAIRERPVVHFDKLPRQNGQSDVRVTYISKQKGTLKTPFCCGCGTTQTDKKVCQTIFYDKNHKQQGACKDYGYPFSYSLGDPIGCATRFFPECTTIVPWCTGCGENKTPGHDSCQTIFYDGDKIAFRCQDFPCDFTTDLSDSIGHNDDGIFTKAPVTQVTQVMQMTPWCTGCFKEKTPGQDKCQTIFYDGDKVVFRCQDSPAEYCQFTTDFSKSCGHNNDGEYTTYPSYPVPPLKRVAPLEFVN